MFDFRCSSFVFLAVAAISSVVTAQHDGDVFLVVEEGQIVTGRINPDQTIDLGVRVFAATFGESGLPQFTSEPGFDAEPGTFPAGTFIGFNALTGWRVWDGDGFIPADGEALHISFASLMTTVADAPTAGFELAVQTNGGWHRHYDYTILGLNGAPAAGVYLLEMELYNTSSTIEPTEPFWKVFNFGMAEPEHDAAIEWVIANLAHDKGSACPGDMNSDGAVDVSDLLLLLGKWGACGNGEACPGDLDGDGAVGVGDLLLLLGAWGRCT